MQLIQNGSAAGAGVDFEQGSPDIPQEADSNPVRMRNLALRIGFATSLICALVWYFDPSRVLAHLLSIEAGYLLLAIAILSTQYLLAVLRWHYVLRRHGLPVRFRQSFVSFGLSKLSDSIFLTMVAGLSARALLLLRQGFAGTRVAGVLLAERLAAIGGMMLCLAVGIASFPSLIERWSGGGMSWPVFWAAVTAALVFSALFAVALWRLAAVRRFAAEMRHSFMTPVVILMLAVLSALIAYVGFAGVASLAWGMQVKVETVFFVAVMPVVAISVGGWGVREGAVVAGLAVFGVPAGQALALSIVYALTGLVVAFSFGALALLVGLFDPTGGMLPSRRTYAASQTV